MVTTDDRLHPLWLAETEAQPSAASHEACKGAGDEAGPILRIAEFPHHKPPSFDHTPDGDNDSWALVPAVLLAIAGTQSVRLRLLVRVASPQHPAPAACVYRHTDSTEGPRLKSGHHYSSGVERQW